MMKQAPARQKLLRMALLGNAAFSVFSATIIVFWQDGLVQWLGIPKAFGILFLGIGLVVFAAWLVLIAVQTQIKLPAARIAVAMDLVWVGASITVVALAPLPSRGKWVVTIVALIVLCFAVIQWIGIQRTKEDNERPLQEVRRA